MANLKISQKETFCVKGENLAPFLFEDLCVFPPFLQPYDVSFLLRKYLNGGNLIKFKKEEKMLTFLFLFYFYFLNCRTRTVLPSVLKSTRRVNDTSMLIKKW